MTRSLMISLALGAISLSAVASRPLRQEIIDRSFRTLKVQKEGDFMAPPLITLGSDERILISFDQISDDWHRLQARLVHCDADWTPSRLLESEFADSFNYAEIDDYAFSSNTFIHFVNYRLAIPSEGLVPLASGNYIAEIYDPEAPDDVLLRARFSVADNQAAISGFASSRTDNGINTDFQQVRLEIDLPDVNLNPYSDIFVTLSQNGYPSSERRLSPPLRVEGRTLVYDHRPDLIFPAGNEFRRFETVRADYPGMGIDSVGFSGVNYQAYLKADHPRAGRQYSFDSTQRGRFITNAYNVTDPDLGADYVTTFFTLSTPERTDGDFYVTGELSDYECRPQFRMHYDIDLRAYTLAVPLKQGSYNYRYEFLPHGGNPDPAPVEGNMYETSNEYLVRVYQRTPTDRADRLIGAATVVTSN